MKNTVRCIALLSLSLLACSPEASKVYLKPVAQKEQITEDPNAQYFDPAVDILFVVDSSASMDYHQRNLASNIPMFTSKFSKNAVLDYHIGVVTTDMDSSFDAGHLVGTTKVVTRTTPSGDQVLAGNIMVGTSGSGRESLFDPVDEALKPANLSGINKNFYRPDATFAVIYITDAEDQSYNVTGPQLYRDLLQRKNQDAKKVLGYGVIIPTTVTNCERDDGYTTPVKIEQFLGLVQNGAKGTNIFSLCDTAFGDKLADMAKDIVDQVGRFMYLNRVPDVSTIQVKYGNLILPSDPEKGWLFDPKNNAIVLGEKIDWASQPSGSRIMIHYETAQFPNQ